MIPVSAPDLHAVMKNHRWADDTKALFFNMYREKRIMALNRNYRGGIDRDSGWVSVNATEMKEGLGLGNRFTSIRNEMTNQDCLQWCRSYTPGFFSRLFRIRVPQLINNRKYRLEWITHPKTIENICDFYNKSYEKQRIDFLETMDWYQPNLEWAEKMFLDDTALDFAEQQSPSQAEKLIGGISTFNSKTGRYISTCDFAGRIHSFAGGMNKKLRPYLRVEDENDELICVDVKSAQPYLLASLFNHPQLIELIPEFKPVLHKITERQHDDSTKQFLSDCVNGELYERLMDATGIKNRDRVKRRLFRHVLYCSASNQHKESQIKEQRQQFRTRFEIQYRSVFETITALKRTQSRTLPFVKELTMKRGRGKMYASVNMMAQRLEVAIFLNMITKRLNEAGIITVTIHDAWIMKKKDHKAFGKVFDSVFDELSIQPPKLDIQLLNGATDIIKPQK